jgi:hypothetical protein
VHDRPGRIDEVVGSAEFDALDIARREGREAADVSGPGCLVGVDEIGLLGIGNRYRGRCPCGSWR